MRPQWLFEWEWDALLACSTTMAADAAVADSKHALSDRGSLSWTPEQRARAIDIVVAYQLVAMHLDWMSGVLGICGHH